jgi:hypothetical protein
LVNDDNNFSDYRIFLCINPILVCLTNLIEYYR